tara:strand:- start:124 stop:1836 length:1713 start_codon:yes stop_codon:yes gene_type:complete
VKKSIILGIFLVNIHSLSAQKLVPTDFSFRSMAAVNIDSTINNMRSNIVTEIILQTNSTVWLGTGLGVSIIRDSLTVETLPSSAELIEGSPDTLLPEGGISAMDILADNKTMVAIAGSKNDMPIGKGLALTTNATDGVISWLYYRQPIDLQSQDTIDWAGGRYNFACLPITVTQANVTYDVAVTEEYAWIASWAGGLRRNNFAGSGWKRVPLPMDDQFKLNTCEDSSYTTVINKEFSPGQPEYSKNVLKDYELNPRDPADEGNHNHKTFSVLVYGDTIWVGTANGINRGIIDADGFDCIDWEHYSYPTDGLSGNFVVSLALQMHKGKRVIWAATVNADDPTEQRGVSYTINDGLSWNTALLGERVYNITAYDSLVFAATANGLWKTEDGINWARYKPARQAIPVLNTAIYSTDELLANEVYSVAFDSRPYYGDNSIWIGTRDGAAHSYDLDGLNWKIFRAEYDQDEDYAYPNPFSPYTHNVIGGDGYVRFHTNEWSGTFVIDLDIYNFAMEKVFAGSFDRRDASSGALKWNGRDTQGRLVNNGVYFVKLKYPENQTSKPSAHWLKLIVVK